MSHVHHSFRPNGGRPANRYVDALCRLPFTPAIDAKSQVNKGFHLGKKAQLDLVAKPLRGWPGPWTNGFRSRAAGGGETNIEFDPPPARGLRLLPALRSNLFPLDLELGAPV
ncbi:hypothetical protein EJA01_03830 [Rhodovulum iodosum]|nr:hypothetical protein EJA01_03830 [Rhodovulum robiginosum]